MLIAIVHGVQARQEAVASKLATALATPFPTRTPISSPAGLGGIASLRRRLEATPGTAAKVGVPAGATSSAGARTLLSSGRRPSAAGGRKSVIANSCHSADKENSPFATGKAQTPASNRTTQLSLHSGASFSFGNPAGRSPLAPVSGSVRVSPALDPPSLQLHMVPVPFWKLSAPACPAAAKEENALHRSSPTTAAAGSVTAVVPETHPDVAEVTTASRAAQQVASAALPAVSGQAAVTKIPITSTATASRASPIPASNRSKQAIAVKKADVSQHDAARAVADVVRC